MSHTVTGIVLTRTGAETITSELRTAGFSDRDISVLMPNHEHLPEHYEEDTKAPQGAAIGAGTGTVVGGTLGWLVGIGSLAIPGIGPFIAAGPILAALGGAAAGAAVGSVTGTLVGMGIPEPEAREYEHELRSGKILVSVRCDAEDDIDRAVTIFRSADARGLSYPHRIVAGM
jgi:hypothetical protein